MGHPEWAADPRFETKALRVEHRSEVNEAVSAAIMADWTMEALCSAMLERKLPYGEINNFKQLTEHPQVAARNMLVNVNYPNGAQFRVPGTPLKMSGVEDQTEYDAYPVGYHTFEVLAPYADEAALHEIYDAPLKECEDYFKKIYSKA